MEGFVKMRKEDRDMNSAVSDVDRFNRMARSLERSEVRSVNTGLTQARKNIAPRLGITADAIENFRSLRNKIVPHWLMNTIRAELISVLQLEVQNLEHEIDIHRQIGTHHSDDALCSAETKLAAAREMLSGEVK